MRIFAAVIALAFLRVSVHPQGTDSSLSAKRGAMFVRVSGIDSDEGRVPVALADSEKSYKKDPPFRGAFGRISGGASVVKFEDIPFGEYAVKCFHDRNSNDKLDVNFFGIPSEGYAFSNGARGRFGPPSFEEAKIVFSADGQVVELKISYLSE